MLMLKEQSHAGTGMKSRREATPILAFLLVALLCGAANGCKAHDTKVHHSVVSPDTVKKTKFCVQIALE
jgi:hypothetical protein